MTFFSRLFNKGDETPEAPTETASSQDPSPDMPPPPPNDRPPPRPLNQPDPARKPPLQKAQFASSPGASSPKGPTPAASAPVVAPAPVVPAPVAAVAPVAAPTPAAAPVPVHRVVHSQPSTASSPLPPLTRTQPLPAASLQPVATARSKSSPPGKAAPASTEARRPAPIRVPPPVASAYEPPPEPVLEPPAAPTPADVERPPTHSTRPTAAWDLQAGLESPSIADTFAAMLNDVDASFGSLQMRKGDSQRPAVKNNQGQLSNAGFSDVRELFEQLAANHMRQVRDFMMDVKSGEATSGWVEVCEPALRSLKRAAEKLELKELCHALDDYGAALEIVGAREERTITSDARDLLIASYDRLLEIMPHAFALDTDRAQREAIIVQALLLQVPGVRKVTIDKLYAAGLTSLEVMFAAKVDDVESTTGISRVLAERIVEKIQTYRKELKSVVPDASRSSERDRLTALARELRRQHVEYEQASAGWTEEAEAKKRYLRHARDETLLQIKVLLARLGEVDRLAEIERLPFQKKIEKLEVFLEEATDRYMAI